METTTEGDYVDNSRMAQILRSMKKDDVNYNAIKEYIDNQNTIKSNYTPEQLSVLMGNLQGSNSGTSNSHVNQFQNLVSETLGKIEEVSNESAQLIDSNEAKSQENAIE